VQTLHCSVQYRSVCNAFRSSTTNRLALWTPDWEGSPAQDSPFIPRSQYRHVPPVWQQLLSSSKTWYVITTRGIIRLSPRSRQVIAVISTKVHTVSYLNQVAIVESHRNRWMAFGLRRAKVLCYYCPCN